MKRTKKDKKLNRILDANRNRITEALRTCEDIVRFYYNNKNLSAKLKNARHKVFVLFEEIEKETGDNLVNYRDVKNDAGKEPDYDFVEENINLNDIVIRNFKRACESIRVCEEVCKVLNIKKLPYKFKKIRFSLYGLEKFFHSLRQ